MVHSPNLERIQSARDVIRSQCPATLLLLQHGDVVVVADDDDDDDIKPF